MRYQRLGNTGLLVSDLCLGTMLFGEGWSRSTPEKEAIKQVHRFQEAGGNYIDTANVYAFGRSEEIVARALKGQRREDSVIATKTRFADRENPGPNDQGLSRHQILTACEDSLRRLGTDYIDLYYLHNWDPLTPVEEMLRAMDDLVTQGKVRYIGVSNWRAWLRAKPAVCSVILGARTMTQLEDNLGAADIDLTTEEMSRLDEVSAPPTMYPYSVIDGPAWRSENS